MEHTPHLKFWCICILAPTPPPQDLGNATSSVELERKVRGRAGQGRGFTRSLLSDAFEVAGRRVRLFLAAQSRPPALRLTIRYVWLLG